VAYNFLVALWGGDGDVGPMLAAAEQLRSRGHHVRMIGSANLGEVVTKAGFRFAPWKDYPNPPTKGDAPDPSDLSSVYGKVFFGPAAFYAANTRDEIAAAPTDAVLAHDVLVGCALAAEATATPCALLSPHISIRPLQGVPPAGSGLTPAQRAETVAASERFGAIMNRWLPMLNTTRADHGLVALDHVLDLYDRPERVFLAISSAFDFKADRLPENTRYVGPLFHKSDSSRPWSPPWARFSKRPKVLISASTVIQDDIETLQRTINAFAGTEIDAIATMGPALEEVSLDAPDNVTLVASAPHDAVMKEVSMVVCHGGHGTVSRALLHGLPLLVVPMGRDQFDNAMRIEFHGAGLFLPPGASETQIATAMNKILDGPKFRSAARRMGKAIASEIGASSLVQEMEDIAAAGHDKDQRPPLRAAL
jgi:MGT family glycosyltransferase